jgi:hypothetical protein
MTNENIDQYITDFKHLGHCAGLNLDDLMALRLFAQGLPVRLTDSCINIENLETFEQWTKAAQRHHRNWLQKCAIHSNYGRTNNCQQTVKVPSGTFVQSVCSFVKSRARLARRASQDQRFDKDKT